MQQSHVLGASVLAGLLLSTAAWADLTADQVWQNWKDQSVRYGQTVTTTAETRSGDTLTITGVDISATADESTKTHMAIEMIALRERGDGMVQVTMSPQIPITLTGTTDGAAPVTVNMLIDQPGFNLIASGSDAETRYDFTAPKMTVTMAVPATADTPADTKATLDIVTLAGTYAVASSDLSRIDSSVTAESATLSLTATDPTPGSGGTGVFTVNATALAGTTKGTMLPAEQMADMAAALAAGFAVDGTFSYGAADYTLDLQGAEAMQSTGTSAGGNLAFGLNKDRMAYSGAGKAATVKLSGAQIPFPELVIAYTESAFDLMIPVSMSDTPQDFTLMTRLVDLTVSDEIWRLFDPTAALPRDPATLVIDTVGKARWLMDIFSPEAENMDTVPGELNALTIKELRLSAVGAEVTGTGDLTFDNTDLVTFEGIPAPTGKIDLIITGANALLDKLSQSGLLPPEQVMGARMGMGLLARPGEGPDTLTSVLEFKDKGFFANGQQLK